MAFSGGGGGPDGGGGAAAAAGGGAGWLFFIGATIFSRGINRTGLPFFIFATDGRLWIQNIMVAN